MNKAPLLVAATAFALALAATGPARAAAPSREPAQKLVAAKLAELEVMVRFKWLDLAEKECANIEAILRATGVSNQVIQQRLGKIRQDLAAEQAKRGDDIEGRRLAALLARVKAADQNFPIDKYRVVRVRPDGSGDAKTLAEGLAQSTDKDLIELATGTFTVNIADLLAKGKDDRGGRASVFIAARGEWPRLMAAGDAEFTFDQRKWLDGVELLPGSKAVGKWTLMVSNCYVRAARPPVAADQGAAGLIHGDPQVSDSVIQNFTTGLTPAKDFNVPNNLFTTCFNAIRRDNEEIHCTGCVFYRCVNATWTNKATADQCLFSRYKTLARDKNQLQGKGCIDREDPFRDPFRGDFRLKSEAQIAGAAVGPRWSEERWDMFAANYNRPVGEPPVGLAEVRDPRAAKALADARKAVEIKDWDAGALAMADVVGKYAACPSVRKAVAEVDEIAGTLLAELVKTSAAGKGDDEKARQLAGEYFRQANAAVAAGKKDEALDAARKAAEHDSNQLDAHQLYGDLLLDAGRVVQAEGVVKHAGDLAEASADRLPASAKARQSALQAKLARLIRPNQDWNKFVRDEAGKYAELAGPPGPPSTALALRRALALAPDNEPYKTKLADAENALRPLTSVAAAPDANRARELRTEADKQFAAKQFHKAVEPRQEAWSLDPAVGDLLFLAQCYQRLQQGPQAATLALQARQQGRAMADQAAGQKIAAEAADLIRVVDPVMARVGQLDQELARQAQLLSKQAEAVGDRDTPAAIARILELWPKLDSMDPKTKPAAPATAPAGN